MCAWLLWWLIHWERTNGEAAIGWIGVDGSGWHFWYSAKIDLYLLIYKHQSHIISTVGLGYIVAIWLCNNINTVNCTSSLKYENCVNFNIVWCGAENIFLPSAPLRIWTHVLYCQKAHNNAHVTMLYTKIFNDWIICKTMIDLCIKLHKCPNILPSKIASKMQIIPLNGHLK